MKKLLEVLTSGFALGFTIGFVLVFTSLRNSYFYVQANQYFQYKLMRLVALSFQESLSNWLKTTIYVAVILCMIWLVWGLILTRITGPYQRSRIERKIFSIKRKKTFKMIGPFKKIGWVLALTLLILNLGIVINNKIYGSSKPNVILIVCETLRADHLGYQGYKTDITDNVDSLAENAFVFKNAYTQAPCTKPSMWNIVTSKYQSAMPAKNRYVTVAEFFKSHNYKTAAFISQQFLTEKKSNLHQGFDVYDAKCTVDKHGLSLRRASSVTDAAIGWIAQNKKRPFFTWLVYFDPHDPYIPPEEFRGFYNKSEKFNGDRRADGIHMTSRPIPEEHRTFLINAYDEEIKYFDDQVGRLFDYLKRSGEYNNSIIILTSDHGEELGDNGHRWDHCQGLTQEEIWIPLLIKMPYQEKQKIIKEAVQNIDVYPTLVEYFHSRNLPSYYDTLDGKSLMSLIEERNLSAPPFAASFWQGQRCIIKGNHKYWLRKDEELFIDIEKRQKINDAERMFSLRDELIQMYNKYVLRKDYYKETEERLKSLGYIK